MMEINDQANLQFRNQYQPSSKHLFKTSDISPVEEIQRLNAFIETGKLRLQSLEKENEMLKKENNTLHNKLKQKGERFNVRPGTVTEWKPEELEMLKEEMMSSMLELQKKDIAQMFEKQQENRWNNENENGDNGMILNELNEEYEDDEEQNPNINDNENENENEEQQLQQLQEEEMNTDDNYVNNNNDEEGNDNNNHKPPRKARESKNIS